jgi:hypothetical protein
MNLACLSEREEKLFADECPPWTPPYDDRAALTAFAEAFIDALSWLVAIECIHKLFPERIRAKLYVPRLVNRLGRAGRRFGGALGALPWRAGLYRWRHLVALLAPDEVPEFTRALLPVLVDLGMRDAEERYASAWLDSRYGDFIGRVNRRESGKRTVLLITSRTDYKPLRESIALRQRGWRTFLVHLEPLPEMVQPMFAAGFDEIMSLPFQPRLLQALIRRMRPDVLHVHCAMWHYHLGRIAIDCKEAAICACEFNDITSFYADRRTMSDYWSPDIIDRDWAMERYICNKADLLVHQWDPGMEPHWRATHSGVHHVIEMQPYPISAWVHYADDKPSKNDGIIRLVWAGQIPGRIACPPVVFDAYYLGEAMEKLLAQGFAVEAFQNPMFTAQFEDANFEFYRKLAERFPLFAIRPGVRLDLLPLTLNKYDFGIVLFDIPFPSACSPPEKLKYMVVNKFCTYFEAGIPIILNWEFECMADFVMENGLGIALRTDELDHAIEHVRAFDYDAAAERIRRYNRDHVMERQIGRLIAGYEEALSRRVG